MGAFELRQNLETKPEAFDGTDIGSLGDSRKLKEECIIALKVYDSCRAQDCLTNSDIGPCRAAENKVIRGQQYLDGAVIEPPQKTAAVTVDRLKVKKVIIVNKEQNSFRSGFWDVDLKYVFEYRLTFREADGCVIDTLKANSIYNKHVTLFGSVGSDISVSTDLFSEYKSESMTIDSEPYVLSEAKAVALDAQLRYCAPRHCHDSEPEADFVEVTIGLFTIIKLFRIVQLSVQSHGLCIPPECHHEDPVDACQFFGKMAFPMDIFSPPQKPEFLAGVSGNIPPKSVKDCGCDIDCD